MAQQEEKNEADPGEYFRTLQREVRNKKLDYLLQQSFGEIRLQLEVDNVQIFELLTADDLSDYINDKHLHQSTDKASFLSLYESIHNQYLAAHQKANKTIVVVSDAEEKAVHQIGSMYSQLCDLAASFDKAVSDLDDNNLELQTLFVGDAIKHLSSMGDSACQYKMEQLRQQSKNVSDASQSMKELCDKFATMKDDSTLFGDERKVALDDTFQSLQKVSNENRLEPTATAYIKWDSLQSDVLRQYLESADIIMAAPVLEAVEDDSDFIRIKFQLPNASDFDPLIAELKKFVPPSMIEDSVVLEWEYALNESCDSDVDLSSVEWQKVSTDLKNICGADDFDPTTESRLIDHDLFSLGGLNASKHYIVRMRMLKNGLIVSRYSDPFYAQTEESAAWKIEEIGMIIQEPVGVGSGYEILSVHVGMAGINLGARFWETISEEHKIDSNGILDREKQISETERLTIYYEQTETMKTNTIRHQPRALFVDSEPSALDRVQSSALGGMFYQDAFIYGRGNGCGNWAKGHYTDGAEYVDVAMDRLRSMVEGCDCPQGFQFISNIGGGTGGGFGSLMELKVRDNYPDRVTFNLALLPDLREEFCQSRTEVYNAVLTTHQLIENSDMCMCLDNASVRQHITRQYPSIDQPTIQQMNDVLTPVLSNITAPFRYSMDLNSNLRRMAVAYCCFPRLHFWGVGHSPVPLINGTSLNPAIDPNTLSPQQIILGLNDSNLSGFKFTNDKLLFSSTYYRGDPRDANDVGIGLQKFHSEHDGCKWIPDRQTSILISSPMQIQPRSATTIMNHTGIKHWFEKLSQEFAKQYRKRSGLWYYKAEGMDEMEFQEADKNVRDLVTEYQDKQDAVVDMDDDDDDDDDDDYSEGDDDSEPSEDC